MSRSGKIDLFSVLSFLFLAAFLFSGCAGDGQAPTDAGEDADAGGGADEILDAGDEGQDAGGDDPLDDGGDEQPADEQWGSVQGAVILAGASNHAGTDVVVDGLPDRQAVTDEQGAYLIEAVQPGLYTVTATHTGYEQRSSSPFQVTGGQVSDVPVITLQELKGSLRGYVFLEGQDDHSGSSVSVQGTIHTTVTSSAGQWSIGDVAAGNYTIIASHDDYLSDTATDQEVSPGQLTVVPNITLVAKGDLGEACNDGSTCSSGLCVDGVCCESECDGFCETCDGDIDGSGEVELDEEGFRGACTQFEPGADPQNECPGQGACDPGCDGTGSCDFECLQSGQPCMSADVCISGYCVNEVCCEQEACAVCYRCDVAGHEGDCHVSPAGSDSDGLCVVEEPCGQNGKCDGDGDCQLFGQEKPCEDVYDCTAGDHCDGNGACLAGDAEPDFLLCGEKITDPDFWYDICVAGTCVSPGTCADDNSVECNSPGPHFPLPPDTGHTDFDRQEPVADQPVVVDNVTGLMWQGCAKGQSGSGCGGSAEGTSWNDAMTYCDQLVWGGFDDWYLPDEYELLSLVDYGLADEPVIDRDSFPNTPFPYYWTTSSAAYDPDGGLYLYVDFDEGSINDFASPDEYYVRCVRRANSPLGAQGIRFERSTGTQPTVTDSVTGLIWQGCVRGTSGQNCSSGEALATTWSDANDYCSGLDSWGNIDSWCLPDPKQLYSILDNRKIPAIDQTAFGPTPGDCFWTGQPWPDYADYYWVAWFDNGTVDKNGLEPRESSAESLCFTRCVACP